MKLKNACKGWWIAALAAGADRLTKIWAPAHPAEISGVVRFRPALLNSGVAFSFLENAGWVLTALITILVLCVVAWLVRKSDMPRIQRIGLWLIAGGGLGNLYDRITYGAVIDFIELTFVKFAVFNVADACICVGAALAIVGMCIEEKRKNAGKAV